jgi:hypothetical protein
MEKQKKFIYKGKRQEEDALIYLFDGKSLVDYRTQEVIITYTIFSIYEGSKTHKKHLLYSCNGKHLFKGPDFNSTEVLLTFDDTRVYRGSSFKTADILFTYMHNHIYNGNSNKSEDIIFTMNGLLPECVMAIILFREEYLKFD